MDHASNKPSPAGCRTLCSLALMALASLLLLAGAWLVTPRPLVKDPLRTELLYVTARQPSGSSTTWHPQDAADQLTAQAIVDYMASAPASNSLRPAQAILETRPDLEIHLRTQDTYWTVTLREGEGWSASQKGSRTTARLLDPQALETFLHRELAFLGTGR